MFGDSFGILDPERDAEYTKEEIDERYVSARVKYLQATDEQARFLHATDVLYFRRIGKFDPKKLGRLRAFAYALLKPSFN